MVSDQEPDAAGNKIPHAGNRYEKQILLEQVKQIYVLAPIGMLATCLNALMVFFVMRSVMAPGILYTWMAVLLAITLLRVGLVLTFKRHPPEFKDASTWEILFLVGLSIVGLAWGSIAVFPFTFSFAHQVFLVFVLGGMAAGACSTFSTLRFGYLAYSIPVLLPLALHFFLLEDMVRQGMGAMILLYMVLLSRIARHNYLINRNSLLLRFENQEMIEDLQRSKEEVETLNVQLLAEVNAKLKAEAELRIHHDHLEKLVEQRTTDLVHANELLVSEIEERKHVETALRESRERLVLAQRAGHVGVFDWDMISNRVIWTGEMEEIFGLQPGESAGDYQGWAVRVHPEDLPQLEAKFRSWADHRIGDVEFEYRFLRPGGEIRWASGNARIIYLEDGTALRMIGTNVDVTEMKQAQETLTAAKNAAEAGSLAKSEFLANMSHEMRTPLAGVLGMIQLVLDMDIGAEERQLLEMAKRSAESLLRIIGDLLDFSSVEAGQMNFESKRFSIAALLESAVEVVSISARERGLQLNWRVEEHLAGQMEGDEGRLRQVLVNLVGNAVKFTDSGSVEVIAAPFEHGMILFTVQDTGMGIAADQLDRIFGKFIQVDASLTKRCGGTGLGLALSRQIVEKMGGRIWVESSIGVGSTFYFTVPQHL